MCLSEFCQQWLQRVQDVQQRVPSHKQLLLVNHNTQALARAP